MTETLAGVSLSKTEDLIEEPSLAEAAVAGVRKADPDASANLADVAEPSAEELAIAGSWSVRLAPVGWR